MSKKTVPDPNDLTGVTRINRTTPNGNVEKLGVPNMTPEPIAQGGPRTPAQKTVSFFGDIVDFLETNGIISPRH